MTHVPKDGLETTATSVIKDGLERIVIPAMAILDLQDNVIAA